MCIGYKRCFDPFHSQGRSQTFFGSTHKVRLIFRDGRLERLLTEGEGGGESSSCTNFFVNISLAGIFFSVYKNFFLGYLLCVNFFHSIFPCMIFLGTSPPP